MIVKMAMDRFHKAAKDGLLDVLKEATRRDCNSKDEAGMTPTLWAAFEGNIDALRLLVARGGKPDKTDHWGNTALHLAAARGHASCVTFLMNFGANPHAMDVDQHTPQELAAINNRDSILRMLDDAVARIDLTDKKKGKSLREKAKKENEKLLKEYAKRQRIAEQEAEKELRKLTKKEATQKAKEQQLEDIKPMPHRPSTIVFTLKQNMQKAGSLGNLTTPVEGPQPYSALVGTMSSSKGATGVQKKLFMKKPDLRKTTSNRSSGDFKITRIEDGRKSVSSLQGVRKDSEVIFVNGKRNISEVFHDNPENNPGLSRTLSQPDFAASSNDSAVGSSLMSDDYIRYEPGSMFDRPGIGSISFRRSITQTLSGMTTGNIEEISIGSAGSLVKRQQQKRNSNNKTTLWTSDNLSDTDEAVSSDDDAVDGEGKYTSLERFLAAWGLTEYVPRFVAEKVDLDALMLLTEDDLKQLGLPLGDHRKLATAVGERRNALKHSLSVTMDNRM